MAEIIEFAAIAAQMNRLVDRLGGTGPQDARPGEVVIFPGVRIDYGAVLQEKGPPDPSHSSRRKRRR